MGEYDKTQDSGSGQQQGQTDEQIIQEKLRRAEQEGGTGDAGGKGQPGEQGNQ